VFRSGAVHQDLAALVEHLLFIELAERPPHRLDVGVVHRLVGVFEVDPAADAVDILLPLIDILQDHRACCLVEGIDTERENVLFCFEIEFLFYCGFDRETVTIPAPRRGTR
jgi:hypothetical protein